MKLFSKRPSKKSHAADDPEDDLSHSEPPSPVKSPTKTPSSSSKTASSKTPSSKPAAAAAAQRPLRAESPSTRESSKPRTSRSFARQSTDPGSGSASSSSRRKKIEPDTHPLNLPPEERKRLSAPSAMSNRNSMDIDREPPASTPSSPPPQQQQQQQQQQANGWGGSGGGSSAAAPAAPAPAAAASAAYVEWQCPVCTYSHAGREAEFLRCAMCASEKP